MFPIKLSTGQVIRRAKQTINLPSGEMFGGTDWTNPDKIADAETEGIFIYQLVDIPPKKKYYTTVKTGEGLVDGKWVVEYTLKPNSTLATIIETKVTNAKTAAGNMIDGTDLGRQLDRERLTGEAVDQDLIDYRGSVVTAYRNFKTAMSACTDYDVAIAMTPEWPISSQTG